MSMSAIDRRRLEHAASIACEVAATLEHSFPRESAKLSLVVDKIRATLAPEIGDSRVIRSPEFTEAHPCFRCGGTSIIPNPPGVCSVFPMECPDCRQRRHAAEMLQTTLTAEQEPFRVLGSCPAPSPQPSAPYVPSSSWMMNLVFDPDVSDTSPVVRDTWVTAAHVVSLVVDGWTWSDILRTHPEITENDLRACLAYTVEHGYAACAAPQVDVIDREVT